MSYQEKNSCVTKKKCFVTTSRKKFFSIKKYFCECERFIILKYRACPDTLKRIVNTKIGLMTFATPDHDADSLIIIIVCHIRNAGKNAENCLKTCDDCRGRLFYRLIRLET